MPIRANRAASCAALVNGGLVVLLCVSSAMADPIMITVDRDGATGKLDRLEATKTLLDERARSDPENAASLRYDRAFVAWWISRALDERHVEEERRDARLEDAVGYLSALLEDDADDVEAMVLLSVVLSDRAGKSVFKRVALGRRAFNLAARAIELAPDNPRAGLQRGKIILYAPAMVGGGPTNAIRLFERSLAAFEKADDRWPNWGLLDTLGWYGRALADDERLDEARAAFQKALDIEPEARWIRDELIPELEVK